MNIIEKRQNYERLSGELKTCFLNGDRLDIYRITLDFDDACKAGALTKKAMMKLEGEFKAYESLFSYIDSGCAEFKYDHAAWEARQARILAFCQGNAFLTDDE